MERLAVLTVPERVWQSSFARVNLRRLPSGLERKTDEAALLPVEAYRFVDGNGIVVSSEREKFIRREFDGDSRLLQGRFETGRIEETSRRELTKTGDG